MTSWWKKIFASSPPSRRTHRRVCLYNGEPCYSKVQFVARRHRARSIISISRQKHTSSNRGIKMIKLLAVFCCLFAATVTVQAAPEKYTTKYDNVNIDEILNNDRLVASYFKCLMETGKCTPEGEEIKRECYSILLR